MIAVTAIKRYTKNTTRVTPKSNVVNETALPDEEKGTVTDLPDHTVVIPFLTVVFTEQPLETVMKVYRIEKQSDNTYREFDVPWGYIDELQPTLTDVTIKINPEYTPDLTGVVIKYKYEAQ